jgi:predicted DNA-binding transcriptional regulator YafY
VTYDAPGTGPQTYRFDPYSLLLFRTGLYFAGFSHKHGKVITPALDHFADMEMLSETFEYPPGYHPSQLVEGSLGLHAGTPVDVVLRFDPGAARFAERTTWHPTQTTKPLPGGGIELGMRVAAEKELRSWICSWGAACEVIAPASLRAAIGEELARAAARYAPAPAE